jgi:hypothetical protein
MVHVMTNSETKTRTTKITFNETEIKLNSEGKVSIFYQASNSLVIPRYAEMRKGTQAEARSIEKAVIINGGANVAFGGGSLQRNIKFGTSNLTIEEFELIKVNPQFIRRAANGFITFESPSKLKADKSAQLTEKQAKEKTPGVTVKTGAPVKG